MYLEKIDIQGFKSFAQPATLVFNRQLTAIVGPNGSGKSNVADAIRWALGEQSLKLLRGKKSDDVIFAGSDAKSRLGFAKVTLYLQNEKHEADIDYEQVVIERAVDRKGESEYFLSGSKVRLSDVQILLAKAHVGQKSYSVIGQGMIDSLLTFSAQERKDFFDEATGVRHFQLKKNQAVHKLEQTEENLIQAELVLQEIEPRLRTLSRHVRRLERKEDLERQLTEAQTQYYSYLSGTLQADLDKASQQLKKTQGEFDTLTEEQRSIQKKLDAQDVQRSRSETYDGLQKRLFSLQEEYNALTKKRIVLESQQDVALIKSGNSHEVHLGQRREFLERKVRELKDSLADLKKRFSAAEEATEKLKKIADRERQELLQLERQLSDSSTETNWETVTKNASELHAEHEHLLGMIDDLSDANRTQDFKQRFKHFAAKLRSFLERLRGSKNSDQDARVAAFAKLNREHQERLSELHEAEITLRVHHREMNLLQTQLAEAERERGEVGRELEKDAGVREKSIAQDIGSIAKELDAKELELESVRTEIDSFNELEENKKNELISLQKNLRTLQYDAGLKNNQLTELKVEVAKLETRRDELSREMTQEMPQFEAVQVATLNVDQSRESITTLKKQLAIIGGIDAETVNEYKEVSEKHTFLKQQTTDLRAAQKSLIELIDDLDEHISKQFQNAFKNINTHFTKYFKRLFSGGNAKLVLTMLSDEKKEEEQEAATTEPAGNEDADTDDNEEEKKPKFHLRTRRFDYMIDIQAMPPGKKLSSMTMLSGGEKALTAIALVCSIIANNPPPFVVLDEVDAALDEANSIRFAEIISELVDQSQFITITHNRATMHQAQILYGVTMGDDGVSRLLSVNFDQADKLSA